MFATRKVNKDYLKDHAAYRLYDYLESIGAHGKYIDNTKLPVRDRIQEEKYRHHQMSTLLRISFNFKESKEGFQYWADISNKLSTIERQTDEK
jgi:hypothetical protein